MNGHRNSYFAPQTPDFKPQISDLKPSDINFQPRSCRGPTSEVRLLEFFNRYFLISIDAHFSRNLHRLFSNLASGKLCLFSYSLRSSLGIRTTAAYVIDTAFC